MAKFSVPVGALVFTVARSHFDDSLAVCVLDRRRIELAVALVCLLGRRARLQAGLVAWLATNFVVYRLGLLWIGYHGPCRCLCSLTGALHISPETADSIMKVVLVYLLIGSYATLLWQWKRGQNARSTPHRAEPTDVVV